MTDGCDHGPHGSLTSSQLHAAAVGAASAATHHPRFWCESTSLKSELPHFFGRGLCCFLFTGSTPSVEVAVSLSPGLRQTLPEPPQPPARACGCTHMAPPRPPQSHWPHGHACQQRRREGSPSRPIAQFPLVLALASEAARDGGQCNQVDVGTSIRRGMCSPLRCTGHPAEPKPT